jgi:hypothetical protein
MEKSTLTGWVCLRVLSADWKSLKPPIQQIGVREGMRLFSQMPGALITQRAIFLSTALR